ncbi:MAG: GNAT family N-acetyltransferase [Caldilineaceae bacterium]|nr:GNAT family N-acetyltransferase [Caldilineaceae bacterium]
MRPLLTLADVARNPVDFATPLWAATGEQIFLRPLIPSDGEKLARFLAGLSPESRRLSTFASYDRATADELCDAIARYDKLRLVLLDGGQSIVGLLEFSFDLTGGDIARYANYGEPLNPATDCRFGPTLADSWQNRGIGSLLLPALWEIVGRFGRSRVILWGGVLADNGRAIRYYEKNGFRRVGGFVNGDGQECCDMIIVLEE